MKKPRLETEFATPQATPGFLLWQICNKWQSEQRKALKTFDLTHVQFVLLASLVWANAETSFTQKELSEYAKTDIMMTSQVVRVLEQKGLIIRAVNPDDSRAFLLHPTKEGITLANSAIKAVEGVDRRFFKVLNNDLLSFTKMMQQLAGSISDD